MGMRNSGVRPMTQTLRVLAHLLSYPSAELLHHLPELRVALRTEMALTPARLLELERLIEYLAEQPILGSEASYVDLFDRGRGTSLHLFEHVHGDSRDRGPAMVDLGKTYQEAGLDLAPGELPDFLPVVLEYASTQPPAQARALLGEVAHIVQTIFSALLKHESVYASVPAALLDLAGEIARAVDIVPDAAIDDTWEEPAAFAGCSSHGQASPLTTTKPIQIIRQANRKTENLVPQTLGTGS
jgi:nitrate reductase delta subunit